jgi:hypothetical protein
MWKELPESEKNEYREKGRVDLERYRTEKNELEARGLKLNGKKKGMVLNFPINTKPKKKYDAFVTYYAQQKVDISKHYPYTSAKELRNVFAVIKLGRYAKMERSSF